MITVVGLDGGPLADRARAALARADVVLGWSRHVELVAGSLPPAVRQVVVDRDLPATLTVLREAQGRRVVLASGDPGFFGIVRAVAAEHTDVTVIPAVSSVAAAFAAAATSWDDAQVVSTHGRSPDRALAVCRRLPKVAVLTGPALGPAELGAALAGLAKRLVVAERLGHPDERVTTVTPHEAAARSDWRDPNVVVVLDDPLPASQKGWAAPPRGTAQRWALPESAFTHRDSMITKAEVRAVALGWLGPGLGDLVWDVGAGSGAVATECARLGAAVIAVDSDPEQCDRARANAAGHDVPVEVVCAKAPEALAALPDPDAVFVGGGGTALTDIVEQAAARARRSVVVALATVERIAGVTGALERHGLQVEATQIHAARLAPLAGGHRLATTNPVFLIRGGRP
ncbi:MAG: precorrin-6y C5,15-methyltransferase (decarboxylating) subunit CbiE [Egibacteraceae bacterium]